MGVCKKKKKKVKKNQFIFSRVEATFVSMLVRLVAHMCSKPVTEFNNLHNIVIRDGFPNSVLIKSDVNSAT